MHLFSSMVQQSVHWQWLEVRMFGEEILAHMQPRLTPSLRTLCHRTDENGFSRNGNIEILFQVNSNVCTPIHC